MEKRQPTRRTVLKAGATAAMASLAVWPGGQAGAAERSRIKQSVCRWCYRRIPLDRLAAEAAKIGYQSIELLTPPEFETVRKHGLTCAILRCKSITNGLNDPKNHDWIARELEANITFAASVGIPNVICMSGNRRGMADDEGLANCARGIKRIIGHAEKLRVTVCMELLNSKIDHKDYMCDRTAWGVELVKRVGSPRFKLLYDIYHMQIMEGDIIRTIRDNREYIGHYHTGGVPGRHEIDDTQELNYAAIVRAILDTGYDGFLGQEFIPSREPLKSMAEAYRICAV